MDEVRKKDLPDYSDDPVAYELEQTSRPDEMAMVNELNNQVSMVLDKYKNAKVLDLCCGTGMSLADCVENKNVYKIVGVDISKSYLNLAEDKYKDNNKVSFIQNDAVSIEFDDCEFDVIILCSAYHHIDDDRKLAFLNNVYKWLSDNGKIVLAENILPEYDEISYSESVSLFYKEVLVTALSKNPDLPDYVRDLINRVAKYGMDGEYEYKTSMSVFKHYLERSKIKIIEKKCVWNAESFETESGNFVMIMEKEKEKEKDNELEKNT